MGTSKKSAISKPTPANNASPLRIAVIAFGSPTFTTLLENIAKKYSEENSGYQMEVSPHNPANSDPLIFAENISACASRSDGLILQAREHPLILRTVAEVVAGGTPVVCFNSDLSNSKRTAFVGIDPVAAG